MLNNSQYYPISAKFVNNFIQHSGTKRRGLANNAPQQIAELSNKVLHAEKQVRWFASKYYWKVDAAFVVSNSILPENGIQRLNPGVRLFHQET